MRPDVAQQAAVVAGVMLPELGIRRAPLAQTHEAQENQQTRGAAACEHHSSVHPGSLDALPGGVVSEKLRRHCWGNYPVRDSSHCPAQPRRGILKL